MTGARGPCIIAVDGPAASGKTTLARRLADHLGFAFLDTGLLYRAVARRLIDAGQAVDDVAAATAAARALEPGDLEHPGLHAAAVGEGASRVAVIPQVREALLAFQRGFGARGPGAVLAGRDVGTIVRPDAACKLFITASLEERARRRFRELQAKGDPTIYEQVLDELRQRDARDRSRVVAPLVPAEDAVVVDTTDLDADAAFAVVRDRVARCDRER